jgi:hypothetical protein|tara:strand:+ start:848 stop:1153 length:306 start_codon:yes stop_codon:yes gene_type:complete
MAKKKKNDLHGRIKRAADQLNGRLPYKSEEELDNIVLIPEVSIKGTGKIFCYSSEDKSMISVYRGQKAFIIEDRGDKKLVYTFDGHLVEISSSELMHTGFD